MSLLAQVPLKDGAILDISRFIIKGRQDDLPEWLLPFAKHDLPPYWGEYYTDLWNGEHENCCDHLYTGSVDGIPCSRMWFGYSLKSRSGNFGNVLTLESFRRRGIMGILLDFCVKDFYESGALFCSCDAAPAAAPAYQAAGFRRIFSETEQPMAIVSRTEKDFASILQKAYGSTEDAFIRKGSFNDRFDCDKLLWYAPEVYGKVQKHELFPDYLQLWSWAKKHSAPLCVLETSSGFCAGYAVRSSGTPFVFLHPAFERYRQDLSDAVL